MKFEAEFNGGRFQSASWSTKMLRVAGFALQDEQLSGRGSGFAIEEEAGIEGWSGMLGSRLHPDLN